MVAVMPSTFTSPVMPALTRWKSRRSSASAMMAKAQESPAMFQVLLAAIRVMVRARASSLKSAKGRWRLPFRMRSQWISSEQTMRSCFWAISA